MTFLPKRNVWVEAIAGLFIFLLVYTALTKLMSFKAFQLVLSRSPLIGKAALAAAVLIPLVELLVAVLLFIPLTRKFGLAAAAILMTVFALYVGYMIVWTPHLPCSCGGILQGMSWRVHLAFNIVAALLALTGWRLQARAEQAWLGQIDQSFIDKQAVPKT